MPKTETSPWGETTFEVGDCRYWRIGPLGFWIRRAEMEWQMVEQRYDDEALVVAADQPEPPEDAVWTRWASGSVQPPVRVRPVTPDRPVVVRPAQPFRILKGGRARIFIRIPVWVRIELVTKQGPLEITEVPTVQLSNTWFGSLFEGNLCYWTETAARRSIDGLAARPHLAVAPMNFHNSVEEELPLEKIRLRTGGLSFYEDARGLWTSEVQATSFGPDQPAKIEVADGPPPEAPGARLVSGPRQSEKDGVLDKAFDFLQTLPGMSGQNSAG